MSNLANLREQRATIADKAQAINAKYPPGSKMPAGDMSELDKLLSQIEGIDVQIREEGAKAQRAGDAAVGGGSPSALWSVDGRAVRTMRTAADFKAHYGTRGLSAGVRADITLEDFVRGVAGLPTTESVRAALQEGTDTAGGYLVPTLVMPQVLEALVPASSLLSAGAAILPLHEGAKAFSLVGIDNVPTAAWRSENGNVAESDPTFRAVIAAPKSLAFYFKVSRELLADAANLPAALVTAISQSFARELDRVGLRGSGTAPEPRGILNTSGVLAVGNGANGAALAGYANIFSAMQSVLQVDGPLPSAAIMSPRSLIKLGGLTDSTGQPVARPSMLQEVQLLQTSQVPNNLTVGTSTDCSEIFVGSFDRVTFAMREQISIQRTTELFATTGQVGFICHVRADVMVTYPKAFAVVTGVRP